MKSGRSGTVLAGLLVVALLGAGCGEPEPSRPGGSSGGSVEGSWLLTAGRGPGGEVPIVEGYRITLHIAEGRIDGTAACNGYDGSVQIDGDSLELDEMFITQRGCPPDSELRFELLAPVPTADLVDTEWHLESMISGSGPEGTASSAAPSTLLLKGDGSFSGTTGCRDIEGEWVERGDEILFTAMSADGHCPNDLQAQDGHVLQALGDGFTAEVEGRSLTVLNAGDVGLVYRAD